jgi:predicted GNAT family N-acyltransferase
VGITIEIAQDAADLASCFTLRRTVFMGEQGVSEAEEFDGEDDICTHIIAKSDGVAVGAARFQTKDNAVKIQRVCVTPDHRGKGFGAELIDFIAHHVKTSRSEHRLILGAQLHAIPFYEKLGFTAFGAEYLDARIPHSDMEKFV